RFRRPDGHHVGTGVARDHRGQNLFMRGKPGCGIAEGGAPFNAMMPILLASRTKPVNFTREAR
ncbi:MAG: hypothetical protein AAFY05_27055, partial [Pseudomonadota bacterium]